MGVRVANLHMSKDQVAIHTDQVQSHLVIPTLRAPWERLQPPQVSTSLCDVTMMRSTPGDPKHLNEEVGGSVVIVTRRVIGWQLTPLADMFLGSTACDLAL